MLFFDRNGNMTHWIARDSASFKVLNFYHIFF